MSIDRESAKFSTKSAKGTENLGLSLCHSLYPPFSKFLLLTGELGAGKTTFVKGLGLGLRLGNVVQSPTYAVERDYQGKLLHLDLFRIEGEEAAAMMTRAKEYEGLVAVEWSEKLKKEDLPEGRIEIVIEEDLQRFDLRRPAGGEVEPRPRTITLTFLDSPTPPEKDTKRWQEEMMVLPNIREHEQAVAELAVKLGVSLLQRNVVVRLKALEAAARVHDCFRFLNFPEGSWEMHSKQQQKRWKEVMKKYSGRHEEACAQFLKEQGYPVIAEIVRTHGVRDVPQTTEQKLLYYADKRLADTRLVSIEERFKDFALRYGESPEQEKWMRQAKAIERELFPEGRPL